MSEKDNYRKTEGILYNHKKIQAEIANLELEIAEVENEYRGCGSITYEEKTGKTNKFSSSVESELEHKEKIVRRLIREKEKKQSILKRLDNAIGTLEGNDLKVIQLKFFPKQGDRKKSWGEIGDIMNLDPDYCRTIKRQAVKNLSEIVYVGEKYSDKYSD